MLFSGIPFLYYYLPVVLLLYAISPKKLKNTVILLSSLVFYAWGEPRLVALMAVTVLCGYVLALLTVRFEKYKKVFLILSLVFSLGFLCYYKYADFFIANFNLATGLSLPLLRVTLPIGISFYTFQILSYNIDVYRGNVEVQKNPINLGAYIAFFPQLIAGPIVRYSDIARQLKERTHSFDKISLGARRFILGLAKKILIANSLGELCDVFRSSGEKSVLFYWLYAIAFTLHIYFDFSGYSDMAIGLGKLFGFDFVENFNYPYISKSITEFWRRWHMSLGTWFRDYVYFPMGGSRVKKPRAFFNIFVVWLLTGFWHGADWNFILWGLYFAVLLVIEKCFFLEKLKKSTVISRIYVLFLVVISFVIFNATSMGQVLSDLGGMFGAGGIPLVSAEALYYLKSYALIFVIAVIGATPLPKRLAEKGSRVLSYVELPFLGILLVVCTAYLVDGSFNPFLYFRF
ncbi:MAG: MBOAT family protein [Clostridia bacterium]|nr:MBOAT family protein [Clostridia bacterium]